MEASAQEYDSIQIVDRILAENRSCKDLEDLQVKARAEVEETWQIRDGLLLCYGKLYVLDVMLTDLMPLRTALIQEAHSQPLSGHPGQTKLKQLL